MYTHECVAKNTHVCMLERIAMEQTSGALLYVVSTYVCISVPNDLRS